MAINMDSQRKEVPRWFLFLIAPFLLNDFANIWVHQFVPWLVIDVMFVKLFPLAFLIYLMRHGIVRPADMGLVRIGLARMVVWTMVLAVLCYGVNSLASNYFNSYFRLFIWGHIPIDWTSPLANYYLYIGIWFIGFLEETIFRGLSWTLLRRRGLGILQVYIVSTILFGIVHWSLGPAVIVRTAIIGAILMLPMWKDGTVLPSIIVHVAVNFVAYEYGF